jgi:hypothetical protein
MRDRLFAAVCLVAFASLPGCIILPTGEGVFNSKWWDNKIGGPESSAPIKIGKSNRDDVKRVLGKATHVPHADEATDDTWQYNRLKPTWIGIYLLPVHHGGQVRTWRYLQQTLTVFFKDGRVSGYTIDRLSG